MYILDLVGTLAFAISGAYKAKGAKLNIFGVVALGTITAVGGGTVRDLIIDRTPMFYLVDPNYFLVAIFGGVLAYFIPAFFKKRFSFFRLLDSLGLAAFVVIGVSVTNSYLFHSNFEATILSLLVSVFMGTLTGVGGGILRDAIMGDTPFAFMYGSNYISSAFWGSLVFYGLMFVNTQVALVVSMLTVLLLREIVSPFGFYKRVFVKIK